jgi:hypothetical protein
MILTPEQQNAVDQNTPNTDIAANAAAGALSGNDYSAANAAPTVPGTPVPMRPAGQQDVTPPDVSGTPGSFSQKFADALNVISSHPNAPQVASQPGGWAKLILGAGTAAMASLGDAAAAGKNVAPGSGWLGGVSKTLAARSQRLADQAKATDEHQETQARIAYNQVQTMRLMKDIYRQDNEDQQKVYDAHKTFVQDMKQNHSVEEGVSQADLNKRVSQDPNYVKNYYAEPIGNEPVLDGNGNPKKDAQGRAITSPVYAIVDRRALTSGEIEVSSAASAQMAKAGYNVPVGTKIPIDLYKSVSTQASSVNAATATLEKANDADLDKAKFQELKGDLSTPAVQSALAQYPGRPVKGLSEHKQNIDQHLAQTQKQIDALTAKNPNDPQIAALKTQQQQMQAEDSALTNVINNGLSDKAREDEVKAQDEERKAKHDEKEEAIQNRRLDIAAAKETQQKGLGDSYKTENKEFDTIRKPLSTSLDAFSTLRNSLDQGTAAGDSVVAPALLKALVAGGGVRITQAEINNFTHGRSTVEDMKGYLQKLTNGKSITPEQRQQVYALLGAVESKVQQKNEALEAGQDALDGAGSVQEQRQAVQDTRRKLAAIDAGQNTTPKPQNQQGQTIGHKVGDTITQNGRPFTVTAVDANGKVTGAQ